MTAGSTPEESGAIAAASAATARGPMPFLRRGVGRPLLLVHGAGADGRIWKPVLATQPFAAIAPTLRWCGPDAWPADGPPFGAATHAADLAALIEALGHGPLPVVGWSFGADVALRLVAERPDLVRAAFLYEPGAPGLVAPASRDTHASDAADAFSPVARAAEAGDLPAAMARLYEAGGGPHAWSTLSDAQRRVARDNLGMLARLFAAGPPDLDVPALVRSGVPLHIVWGGASRPVWTLPSIGAAALPNAVGEVIGAADHLWPLKAPETFAARIASWAEALEETS